MYNTYNNVWCCVYVMCFSVGDSTGDVCMFVNVFSRIMRFVGVLLLWSWLFRYCMKWGKQHWQLPSPADSTGMFLVFLMT